MGMLLLVTGLNASRPELSGLVTDVLIAAVNDGRLDGNNLGETLAEMARINVESPKDAPAWNRPATQAFPVPFVKLNRWAKVLGATRRGLRRSTLASSPKPLSRTPARRVLRHPDDDKPQHLAGAVEGTPDRDL